MRWLPADANRPLASIVVLDFGQVYQGPCATLMMAKAGADVIKIEPAKRHRIPLARAERRETAGFFG